MENQDLITIKEEPFEDYFFTITEVSEDEDLLKELPRKEPQIESVIPTTEPNISVKCETCNKGFLPKELKIHLATAHITTTECPKCKEPFPSNWYLSRHDVWTCNSITNQKNKGLNMDCKGCNKKFLSIWDLKLHVTACKFRPIKKRTKIEKACKLKSKRKNKSIFACSVCKKEFTSNLSYVRHKHSNCFRSVCRIDDEN